MGHVGRHIPRHRHKIVHECAVKIGVDPPFTIHDREDSADLMNLVRHESRVACCEFSPSRSEPAAALAPCGGPKTTIPRLSMLDAHVAGQRPDAMPGPSCSGQAGIMDRPAGPGRPNVRSLNLRPSSKKAVRAWPSSLGVSERLATAMHMAGRLGVGCGIWGDCPSSLGSRVTYRVINSNSFHRRGPSIMLRLIPS